MTKQRGVAISTSYRETSIQHISRALAQENLLSNLYVPLELASLHARTTWLGRVGRRLQSICQKRMYLTPAVSTAPIAEAAFIATSALPFGARTMSIRRAAALDRAVLRRLQDGTMPMALIGMPMSCEWSFRWARKLGVTTFFNQVNPDLITQSEAFRAEAGLARSSHESKRILRERWPVAAVDKTRREMTLADFVFAPSRFVKSDLQANGIDDDRIVLLPYGTDVDGSTMPTRDNAPRSLRILYVGQVGYRKGLQYLADAVKSPQGRRHSLIIAGPIVNHSRIVKEWSLEIHYVGKLNRSQLVTEYRKADVFVLPSLAEGMALVVLEAMAFGLPVIVTPECGYEGIVRDGVEGFVVPSRNATEIAQRLEMLSENGNLRARMGLAARRRAEEFSWSRFEHQLIEEMVSRVPNLAPLI
jgi:glycosyltransferase involved in cell wall biosynthesis